MNWLTNFVRPKIQSLMRRQEVPEHFWRKCLKCEHMLFHEELKAQFLVCHHCHYHFRQPINERLAMLYDEGAYTLEDVPAVEKDPLKFKDTKKYVDRLAEYRQKTGKEDSVIVAYGMINSIPTVSVAFDFAFMGGSMGMYAGQAFSVAADLAVHLKAPLIAITASGGARMQEGILSLMQMPRTIAGVLKVKEAGSPYITLLTDPTTGGVTASFAMLGDIALSEPGALIGFAGARVIQETIRQKLPSGFQSAEYLLDHGMIDKVVHRHRMKDTLSQILTHLTSKKAHVRLPIVPL